MSEFNAALGLLQLRYFEEAVQRRKAIDTAYREGLEAVPGIQCIPRAGEAFANYAYFPIRVGQEYPLTRDSLYQKLKEAGIYGRRYFYPLISSFPMYRELPSASPEKLAEAVKAAQEVICLPIYPELSEMEVLRVVSVMGVV